MSQFKYTRWGRTRQPNSPSGLQFSQNLAGNQNYILPYANYGALGDNWDRANLSPTLGLVTENQRYMHLLIDASTMDSHTNKNLSIGVLGYVNAFGIWTNLLYPDKDGHQAGGLYPWIPNFGHVVGRLGEGTSAYHILEILGVDRVLFYNQNSNADEEHQEQIVRVAFNTF